MKIRNGFVTNSSSSSFIIGKANDNTVTIDSVYQEIKELAYFSKGRDFQIHANIMYKNKVIGASCKIQHQQELQYCLILVTFLGSDTLHCVCDF